MSEREEAMKRHPSYTEPVDETNEPEGVMNANDRCDACQAQAYYLVKMLEGELYFCRHHFLKHEETLNKISYEIIDESIKLEPQKVEAHA
jgi:hypothetical protein